MHRGRSIVAALVMAATAVGCEGGSSSSGDGGGNDATPEVERVTATGAVPWPGPFGVMEGTLVGLRPEVFAESGNVVVSHDEGRTWTEAELPDRPAKLELATTDAGLYVDDDVAVVVGRDPTSASATFPISLSQFLVWATTDGDGWTGHVLETAGGVVGTPTVTAVGPLLVAFTSSAEGFNLFTSNDHGSSWRRVEVSGLDRLAGEDLHLETVAADTGELRLVVASWSGGSGLRRSITSGDEGSTWSAEPCGPGCPDPTEAGGLIHRFGETSTDGGRTWHEIEIDPTAPYEGVYLTTVTEVEGGWLASASREVDSTISYGMLLRSDDGRYWRNVLPPDPCDDVDASVSSEVKGPIRFGGHWYVTYDCSDFSTTELGVVHVGDEDGREFQPVEGTEREHVAFGDPIVDDDRLLIPEFDDEALVAITTIRS